jgi:hypothetical protein
MIKNVLVPCTPVTFIHSPVFIVIINRDPVICIKILVICKDMPDHRGAVRRRRRPPRLPPWMESQISTLAIPPLAQALAMSSSLLCALRTRGNAANMRLVRRHPSHAIELTPEPGKRTQQR